MLHTPICPHKIAVDIWYRCILLTRRRERSKAGMGGDDLDENFELSDEADEDASDGGSGDGSADEDGGEGSESDEAGDGPLQRRQKQRAAGYHELQARFRCTAAYVQSFMTTVI